jgi:hypothetical protein
MGVQSKAMVAGKNSPIKNGAKKKSAGKHLETKRARQARRDRNISKSKGGN